MHRRAWGLALIALTVLAALVAPNLGARTVPGLPRASALPGPPAVGSCLLTPVSASYDPTTNRRLWIGDAPRYGPCSDARIGEVVLVEPEAGTPPPSRSLAYRPTEVCARAADDYLGLPAGLDGDDRVVGSWIPGVDVPTVRLAPGEVQQIRGQRWAACVVLAPGGAPGAATSRTPLRDLFRTGSPPDAFGWCTDTADPVYSVVVQCDMPHQAEGFGFLDHLAGTGEAERESTCRALVGLLTRMPDPTAGGELTVRAAAARNTGGAGRADDGFAVCQITAPSGRALDGTLLGLGTGSVPWA